MSTSKIKIKLGPIEIEYEGSETFLKEELPQLLSAVSDLYAKSRNSLDMSTENVGAASRQSVELAANPSERPQLQATTGSVAAKLGVKSGPDLIMAAAARLTLALQIPTFTRQQISNEMKTASAYFKANYLKNLSSSLNGLVKDGKLNEPSQSKYALTAASLKGMEKLIV